MSAHRTNVIDLRPFLARRAEGRPSPERHELSVVIPLPLPRLFADFPTLPPAA